VYIYRERGGGRGRESYRQIDRLRGVAKKKLEPNQALVEHVYINVYRYRYRWGGREREREGEREIYR